ncbi:helix-turn-helix transcriptional regulator, partial [Georgenia sp. 10Sc9-8]|nr:helix-turn-helix transcriptional regulator [Georgenia halotolerans]
MEASSEQGPEVEQQQDGTGHHAAGRDGDLLPGGADDGDDPLLPPGREGLAGIVGANIRYEAVRYELTQDDLARAIGRSRAAVSARYTGKVAWTLAEVGKIAELMGLPPADLVTQTNRP